MDKAIKEDNCCFDKQSRTIVHDLSHQVTAEH